MPVAASLFGQKLPKSFPLFLENLYQESTILSQESLLLSRFVHRLEQYVIRNPMLGRLSLPETEDCERDYVLTTGMDGFMCLLVHCKPGYKSDLHDHSSWAISVVLSGVLEHQLYACQGKVFSKQCVKVLRPGQGLGLKRQAIHRICNPSQTHHALSLHLYAKDLRQLKRFRYDQKSGQKILNPNEGFIDMATQDRVNV